MTSRDGGFFYWLIVHFIERIEKIQSHPARPYTASCLMSIIESNSYINVFHSKMDVALKAKTTLCLKANYVYKYKPVPALTQAQCIIGVGVYHKGSKALQAPQIIIPHLHSHATSFSFVCISLALALSQSSQTIPQSHDHSHVSSPTLCKGGNLGQRSHLKWPE
jgi:hypothetical protein